MKGCLWDEAVWEGQAEDARDACCETKEEDIPMEAGGFSKREFATLGDQGGNLVSLAKFTSIRRGVQGCTIVVKPKENREQNGKGESSKNLPHTQIPEIDKPASPTRGLECKTCRQHLEFHISHPPDVDKPREEDECQGCPVIFQKDTNWVPEQAARSQLAADICHHEDK